jgi:hypothetical protein
MPPPSREAPLGDLPPITAADVEAAARSFRQGTTHIEGWRPRFFATFSSQVQEALAGLLMVAEDFGNYPEAIRQVLTVLIPKPDGGMRPINLFPGIWQDPV